MMRLSSLIQLVLYLLLISSPLSAKEVPLCEGKNLVEHIQQTDRDKFQYLKSLITDSKNSDGIFWKLSDDQGKTSYLFGTVHSTDPRVKQLPQQTKQALSTARNIAVEIANLDEKAAAQVVGQRPELFFSLQDQNKRLDRVLSREDYAALLEASKAAGIPANMLPALKPWFASISFFAIPGCEKLRMDQKVSVLDAQITQLAKSNGIPVIGLETIEEQYRAFAALPFDHQLTMLKNGIYSRALLADMYATTVALYLSRQLEFIMPLSLLYSQDLEKSRKASASFKEILLDKRNINMHERSLPLVKQGGAFIAVGALHLVGEKGLVELFRKSGYKVEKIY